MDINEELDIDKLLDKIDDYFSNKSNEEIEEDLISVEYYKYRDVYSTYIIDGIKESKRF